MPDNLRIRDIADEQNCHEHTVLREIHSGRLKAHRLRPAKGGRGAIRVRRDDYEAWLAAGIIEPKPAPTESETAPAARPVKRTRRKIQTAT